MPVEKIPVEHKFGILSQSHRVNLEKQLKLKELKKQHADSKTRQSMSSAEQTDLDRLLCAVEDSQNLTANELIELQANAEKILDRCKRKAGLGEGGIGPKTNLNLAWSELGLLSTCNILNIREQTLQVLIDSLHEAPITRKQVPVLFQLADVVLKSLISDQIDIGSAHTIEVLLIEISQVVFTRLYYHHLATDITSMEDHSESVDQIYLLHKAVLKRTKNKYKSLPAIAATLDMVKDVVRELTTTYCPQSLKHDVQSQQSTHDSAKGSPIKPLERCISSIEEDPLHDSSPFMWHALRVFQCATHVKKDLPIVMSRLHCCTSKFALGPQLQQILAVRIFCESAKNNAQILTLFLSLPHKPVMKRNERAEFNSYCFTVPPAPVAEVKNVAKRNDLLEGLAQFLNPDLCSRELIPEVSSKLDSADIRESTETLPELQNLNLNKSPVNDTDYDDVDDSEVEWPVYLWIVFMECLTDICLHGLTSDLQTQALVGNESNIYGLLDYALYDTGKEDDWIVRSAAIAGVTQVVNRFKSDPLKDGFMSLANRTLMRHMDVEKDLRVREAYKHAQATLLRGSEQSSLHFSPRQKKPTKATTPKTSSSKGVYEKIATNLSVLLLPRVEPLAAVQSQSVPLLSSSPPKSITPQKLAVDDRKTVMTKISPKKIQPNRTTINDELLISNVLKKHKKGYAERAWKEVTAMVEDQYAKEVLEEEAYREEMRQKELQEKMIALRAKDN